MDNLGPNGLASSRLADEYVVAWMVGARLLGGNLDDYAIRCLRA